MGESRLLENKQRFASKIKDQSEEILKNLFMKWSATTGIKTHQKSSLDQLKSYNSAHKIEGILTDPKCYLIINKAFKRMANRKFHKKNNQKNLLSTKEGKNKKKMFISALSY